MGILKMIYDYCFKCPYHAPGCLEHEPKCPIKLSDNNKSDKENRYEYTKINL